MMEPLAADLLTALRARPGRRIHELADDLGVDRETVEAVLRLLERERRVRRELGADHVVGWHAGGGEAA